MSDGNDETARARSMLRAWALGSASARRDLDHAVIGELRAVGPSQVVLRSHFEIRGVRYTVRPGIAGTLEGTPPDPWAAPLALPEGALPGHESVCPIAGEVAMGCLVCGRQGRAHCDTCAGTGQIRRDTGSNRHVQRCERCGGRGEVRCETCAGSGVVYGAPTAWARMEQVEIVRVIEGGKDELPLEVFLDLQDTTHGGETIHRQREPQITELRLASQGGYRGSAAHGPLSETVARMLASPDVPDGARLHAQELEVRRVPAFAMMIDGAAIVVYGEPAQIHPASALRSKGYYALRAIPIVLTAIAAIAAAFFLTR